MNPPENYPFAVVQQPWLQGHQPVAALWFPASWFDDAERARRLLAHWQVGATALGFAQGDLLRYAWPLAQTCEALGGWPLRKHGSSLCSAPLTNAEAGALPVADLWLVQGGQVTALNFSEGRVLDPSLWLATSSLALHDTYDCRVALSEPITLVSPDVRDVREVLNGRIAQASQEQRAFLQAMAAKRRVGTTTQAPPPSAQRSLHTPALRGTMRLLLAVISIISMIAVAAQPGGHAGIIGLLGLVGILIVVCLGGAAVHLISVGQSQKPSQGQSKAGSLAESTLPARRQGAATPQAWRQWLARLAITSQVSRLLGRRQAAYMRKMMALFESGQLDEALRHAIPLDGDQASLGQAFGTPQPRQDLSLRHQPGLSTSIHFGQDLDAYLRRLYRLSFEKLDREGRIDEAVFVLAELLQARQEALDYLEKHTRFQQAAELALAWDQSADMIVRLHALAGDWRRAIAVARRDNAFANAVMQLEKRWPDAGAKLREEWAQTLATQGDWLEAVEAIWPLASRRVLAADWLLNAQTAGGQLGARALLKRAVLMPDTLLDDVPRLEQLRDDPNGHLERAALAEALLALKEHHASVTQLARIVAPAVLMDQAAGCGHLKKNDLRRLLTLADNAWLNADLPSGALPNIREHDLARANTPLQGPCPSPGSLAIVDAAPLHDGQHLVALGEAGAVVIDQHGNIVSRFAVPAQRIVMAYNKQVALVMARRDQVWRVSRLELMGRRVIDLGMAELDHVAYEFNGLSWTVANGTRLRVLDTQHTLHDVLWQVTDLPGQVCALSTHLSMEQVVLQSEHAEPEIWRYLLPQRRLVARGEALPERVWPASVQGLHPGGGVIEVWHTKDENGSNVICYRMQHQSFSVPWSGITAQATLLQVHVARAWLLVGLSDETNIHWCAISLATRRIHARIEWPSAANPQARITDECCVIFDTQGRLWNLNMATSVMKGLSLRSR